MYFHWLELTEKERKREGETRGWSLGLSNDNDQTALTQGNVSPRLAITPQYPYLESMDSRWGGAGCLSHWGNRKAGFLSLVAAVLAVESSRMTLLSAGSVGQQVV